MGYNHGPYLTVILSSLSCYIALSGIVNGRDPLASISLNNLISYSTPPTLILNYANLKDQSFKVKCGIIKILKTIFSFEIVTKLSLD